MDIIISRYELEKYHNHIDYCTFGGLNANNIINIINNIIIIISQ